MKLERLEMVTRHAERRKQLAHQLGVLEGWPGNVELGKPRLCVTIDGERQSDEITALIKPVLICALRSEIARVDHDLAALGVEVEAG